jgi:hypothetical protein
MDCRVEPGNDELLRLLRPVIGDPADHRGYPNLVLRLSFARSACDRAAVEHVAVVDLRARAERSDTQVLIRRERGAD